MGRWQHTGTRAAARDAGGLTTAALPEELVANVARLRVRVMQAHRGLATSALADRRADF